jgi:hypothetical protein
MPNENEVAQLLSFNNGKDVFHMGPERNVFGEEMCPIPHSGERWRKNPVPGIRENIGDTTPAPAPVPRTMHQDEGAEPHRRFTLALIAFPANGQVSPHNYYRLDSTGAQFCRYLIT